MERSYGAFSRVIPLPSEVEQDKVEATFKKGILTVKMPRTEKTLKESVKLAIKSE